MRPVLIPLLPLALGIQACGEEAADPATSPPVVVLTSPNGGEFAPEEDITWRARDDDEGDVLSIDIELSILDSLNQVVSTEVLATGLENFVGTEDARFDWQRGDVPLVDGSGDPIAYLITISATDLAGNSASDSSDEAFTLLDPTALENLDWEDVSPIFLRFCGDCHREPAASPGIDYFRLDKYDATDIESPTNDDIGVFEMRAAVERELLQLGSMPPSGRSQPSAVDKLRIERWLGDGAPLSSE